MAKLVGRIKGTLRCADGAVIPITSKRVLDAIREQDERITLLGNELNMCRVNLRASRDAMERLQQSGWVRLGRWLRIVR